MKSKLIGLFLLIWVTGFSQSVPNTTTFSLQDVINAVSPSSNDLVECFNDANPDYFNDTYKAQYYAEYGNLNNLLMFRDYGAHNALTVVLFTSSGTWTVPTGVTSVTAECWGGGGAGGAGGTGTQGGGGGGGGGYHKATATVTPGTVCYFTVGSGGVGVDATGRGYDGGQTTWAWGVSVPHIVAGQGYGGSSYDYSSAGGSSAGYGYSGTLTGRVYYYGGSGSSGSSTYSGAGGGGAGSSGTGDTAGAYNDPGNSTIDYGGGGGLGKNTSNANGSNGSIYGGGGGGATGTGTVGSGAAGLIRITY